MAVPTLQTASQAVGPAPLLALLCAALAHGAAAEPYTVNGSAAGLEFDGHGGLSAGATTRLLIEYPEPQRSEVLDYLFKPNFGASLAVLKVEIGGDTQSTDGTEASHSHFRGDLNCNRGYEGWLAAEARKRNPNIKVWSLAWGVPGWIGNGSYFSPDNIEYQVQWLKCLRDAHGVEPDYLGLWNERPQGSVDYIITLRDALNAAGFGKVGITIESTWQELVDQIAVNSTFNDSIVAATKHYPCNETTEVAVANHKKFWAGEDTPTHFGNWTGASCWGRKLNQHYIKMNATSTVAWAVVWSTLQGVGGRFFGNAFLNASESWSGYYDVLPVVWINAHWHQFASPGWRFLQIAPGGGAGMLAGGTGSYVTLVPPQAAMDSGELPANTFTMIVETLDGRCGSPGSCDTDPITAKQSLEFHLQGPLATVQTLHLWCSSSDAYFVNKGTVQPSDGVLSLEMDPDTICTVTTLSSGTKGQHPAPPASRRFPSSHSDDFASYPEDTLAFAFSDVYGSFAVRNQSLTQVATAMPTGWAPTNYDPLTFIGDNLWSNVRINVSAMVNHTAEGHYVRLCGGCGNESPRVIKYGCDSACCFNISWTGSWTVGGKAPHTGKVAGFGDTWHDLGLAITNGTVAATVDGVQVAEVAGSCMTKGTAALGCGSYHMCAFRDFRLEGSL